MHFSSLVALVASVATASAQTYQGFNYGSTNTDGSAVTEPQFEARFNAAKNLVGTSGFTSARLFTMIQAGTTNTPIEAIQAAINTDTSLLLGFWASAGQANIDNELAAFSSAITAYGSDFTDLIVGISVGSEDLYRISPTGIENLSGIGAGPDEVADYINQVKQAIGNTPAAGSPVGHVDTWTAWVNGSNSAVITASDFIGMDAYPYFQNTMMNDIGSGYSLFFSAYDQTVAAVAGKPVWVTETGWPVSGPTENLAVPNTDNAKSYWDEVGCGRLFGKVNTWWYILQDSFPNTPSPSFGVVGAGTSGTDIPTTPLYDLSCPADASNAISSASVIPSSANPAASAQAGGNNGAQRENEAEQSGANAPGSATPSETPALNSAESSPSTATDAPPPAETPVPNNAGSSSDKDTNSPAPTNTGDAPQDKVTPYPTTLITKTTTLPAASAGPSGCPASLSGNFEFPHLIVPVIKHEPDTAQGTSYNGSISPSTSSIFNFDIRAEDSGKTCSLIFLLPTQDKLETSAFSLSGSGGFQVAKLDSPATEQTTYNSVPHVAKDLSGPSDVSPGNEYVIASAPCEGGSRVGYRVSATGSFDLNYFQDYNPSPIGFYITVC